jgi:hypothetical protein
MNSMNAILGRNFLREKKQTQKHDQEQGIRAYHA